jgi:TIR domain-containing protein
VGQVFISYRRDDSAGHAGRLYDQLTEDLTGVQIFMDVDAIGPGVDFVERIESAVASADVFLAVIGRSWLTLQGADGHRRLDDPDDYVRREIGAALRRRMTVIPVLVGGGQMPSAEQLPADLAPLTRRNALILSDLEWRAGIAKLVTTLKEDLEGPPPRPRKPKPKAESPPAREDVDPGAPLVPLVAGLVGAGLLAVATALRWDTLVHPNFGNGTVPNLGAFTAPASIGILVGVLYALLKVWRTEGDAFSTGLLLGFSMGGIAKYVSLIGMDRTNDLPEQFGPGSALVLGLAGSAITAAVAIYLTAARHRQRFHSSPLIGRVFAPVGAILIAAATLVPFNISVPETKRIEQVILQRNAWEAVEPFLLALAIVLGVLLGAEVKRPLVSGLFVAVGIAAALYWIRYIGVPALQMLDQDNLASIRAGGLVGLAGAALVWRAGVIGRDRVRAGGHPQAGRVAVGAR